MEYLSGYRFASGRNSTRFAPLGARKLKVCAVKVGFRFQLLALLDPDLPVDVRRAEGEVVAAHAFDDALADDEGLGHVGHKDVVRVAVDQVPRRRHDVERGPGEVEHLFDCAGGRDGGVDLLAGIEERQRLAVVVERLLDQVADAVRTQLVGALHRLARDVVELDLLPGGEHDLERAARLDLEALLRRQEVGGSPEQPGRLRIDAGRLRPGRDAGRLRPGRWRRGEGQRGENPRPDVPQLGLHDLPFPSRRARARN